MDELTIALLTSEFGQDKTLGNVVYKIASDFGQHALQNRIRLWATCFTKSNPTLGNMLYEIA